MDAWYRVVATVPELTASRTLPGNVGNALYCFAPLPAGQRCVSVAYLDPPGPLNKGQASLLHARNPHLLFPAIRYHLVSKKVLRNHDIERTFFPADSRVVLLLPDLSVVKIEKIFLPNVLLAGVDSIGRCNRYSDNVHDGELTDETNIHRRRARSCL